MTYEEIIERIQKEKLKFEAIFEETPQKVIISKDVLKILKKENKDIIQSVVVSNPLTVYGMEIDESEESGLIIPYSEKIV